MLTHVDAYIAIPMGLHSHVAEVATFQRTVVSADRTRGNHAVASILGQAELGT